MWSLPDGFECRVFGPARVVARPEAMPLLRNVIERHGSLHAWAAAAPDARPLAGRITAFAIAGPGGEDWVVRHFHRGGAAARWLGDRYLRLGEPRPLAELEAVERARERGVPTAAVAAVTVYPAGVFYRADIATHYIPDSLDLAAVSFGADRRGTSELVAAWRAAGSLIRHALDRGVIHADLNLKNILLAGDAAAPDAFLLDLDRCRIMDRATPVDRAAVLTRLERSRRKWERRTGQAVAQEALAAFEHAFNG